MFNFFESKSFIEIPLRFLSFISDDEYLNNGILYIEFLFCENVTDFLLKLS